MFKDKTKFGIIGAGVVGTALAVLLSRQGWQCVGVKTRSRKSFERFYGYLPGPRMELDAMVTEADVILITTQDAEIEKVAEQLSVLGGHKIGQIWVHCSGSIGSRVMRKKPWLTIQYLSIHPLQAFAHVDNALAILKGTHFGVEGNNRETEEKGREIVRLLGGIPHIIDPDQKTLYHAGAVVASNYMVSLAELAVRLFAQAGIKEDALKTLMPLMKGALHNIENTGLPGALTGPVARGDWQVVQKHLDKIPVEMRPVYKNLGVLALEIGTRKKELRGERYDEDAYKKMTNLLGLKQEQLFSFKLEGTK
ncbi:Domain of unknown function DUF2520-containing protein [Syntrophobotulus glycolicus DSM 8271]|uniref:DUF2520 domain-containing protein n=1 Tax=Syntrophobotulus glycolicus (strain DSM 8271 / FlGlyR) TaxID=645991 RepID=F0SWA3_SYNGF|nr:Rossmann-like and DUF2520 domain-containing protein [Syntrophobotulus glycolicus]ADY54589.1 Domain of unknown function DUF2520-containing protein [Syntrophobotulus glycolicus DSM 8271]